MTLTEIELTQRKSKALLALVLYCDDAKDERLLELLAEYVEADTAYLSHIISKVDEVYIAAKQLKG